MAGTTHSAQQLAKEGKKAYEHGEYLAAAQAFVAAREAYIASGQSLDAAEMANNASVAYLQAEDGQAALEVVEGTDQTFAQAGDLRRHGMALGNRAAALEALDRDEEAIQTYFEAAKVLEQAGEDQLRASTMQSLSMLQFQMGRQLQALASMHSGIEGVKRPTPKQIFLKRLLNIPMDMLAKKKS